MLELIISERLQFVNTIIKEDQKSRLNAVVITHELLIRSGGPKNIGFEKESLTAISRQMANGEQAVLHTLCELALRFCQAGSAGISLLDPKDQEADLRWSVVIGDLKAYEGGVSPRHNSPCSYCLERNSAQLFSHPGKHFTWLQPEPPIVEALVVPFFKDSYTAFGTIWVTSHHMDKHFDRADLTTLSILANHVSAALQVRADIYQ